MGIDTIINRIGFVISIVSAIYTGWQAHRAKKIADEIKDTKLKVSLDYLLKNGIEARDEVRKIAFQNSKNLRGFNVDNAVVTLLKFIENLSDKIHLLSDETLNEYSNSIKKDISKYQKENDIEKKQEIGKSLYEQVSKVVSLLDEKSANIK